MLHLFIINPAAGSRDRTKQYSEIIHKICGVIIYIIGTFIILSVVCSYNFSFCVCSGIFYF